MYFFDLSINPLKHRYNIIKLLTRTLHNCVN